MAMTDAKSLFIDTNVLIYANVGSAPLHQQALDALKTAHQSERPLWLSRQVLREFVCARTRPQLFTQPSTPSVVTERVRYLQAKFIVADDTHAVTEQLIQLIGSLEIGGKQVHDANIVATMLVYDIPCLLTHNVKDFRRFAELIAIEGIEEGNAPVKI